MHKQTKCNTDSKQLNLIGFKKKHKYNAQTSYHMGIKITMARGKNEVPL